MTSLRKRTFLALGALLAALPFASVASGQAYDEFGDEASPDVIQTVARVSYMQGSVSYARGDDPDDWQAADLNVPMTLGDRIYTSRRSRAELQVHGGDVIWLGSRTDLVALNLTDDTKQFALKLGIASVHVRRLDGSDVWEIDTPNAAVTIERPGDYRISVDPDGNTRVSVQRGAITVAAGGGEIDLSSGEGMVIEGIENPRYDLVSVPSSDPWDNWVRGRSGRVNRSSSYQYVSADVVGAGDLDEYGSWSQIPNYGTVWAPSRIDVGWAPYRQGHWIWQDPWGWTWVSTEPWGWAPYHYGRWVTYSSRWFWVPAGPSVRVDYAPALVAFVGGSPGFSASVTIGGGGYVGWFPLAPRERYVPWWAPQSAVNVNVTNVTYVNRTYVTVVNQNTFVSGGLVARNVVTDRTVIRQVATAPVVHGTVPVLPTNASLRATVRSQAAAPRPPAAVLARSVVARVAPPPAPPSFQQKAAAIRENRRPVDPTSAARIATQAGPQARAAVPVRSVVADQGRVTLAPRSGAAPKTAPRPMQAAPVRGRAMAVPQQPVAPATGSRPRVPRPASPGATAAPDAGRPGAPEQRPGVERERVDQSRPEARPQTPGAQQPAQTAPYAVRPTPIERQQREAAPENRPDAGQRAPVPRQPDERVRPTVPVSEPGRSVQPEDRVRPQAERTQPPNWRARPTPRLEPREATPQRERVQQEPPQRQRVQQEAAPAQRERVQQDPAQRQRVQQEAAPPQRERVATPPASREVVRPDSRRPPERPAAARPDERTPRSRTPRPRPTPDDARNPN